MTQHPYRLAATVCVGVVFSAACSAPDSPVGTTDLPTLTSRSGDEHVPNVPTSPTEPATADPRQRQLPFEKILCFGDSLTAGVTAQILGRTGASILPRYDLTSVEGYVPKLRRLLREEFGDGVQLTNSGIGAEDTELGLARLRILVRSQPFDLVLLLEGVVDVNSEKPRFEEARFNLVEMMRVVQGERIEVIIGTYPRLNTDGFRTKGAGNVPILNGIIREEADRERVLLADHARAFGSDGSLMGPDGLHPNDNGYRLMAETWFEAILQLVAEAET